MSRLKTKPTAIITRTEAEEVCGQIARDMNDRRRLSAEMDAELKAVRDRYQARITALGKSMEGQLARLQDWAESNPTEFVGKRSIEMMHGRVGWRLGQPQLKPLSGTTWARVLEIIGEDTRFLRMKPEVNKEALIAARDEIGAEGLRALGVKVVQEEDFFVEPKLTDTETRVEGVAA